MMKQFRTNTQQGFTLVELIIAIAVSSIVLLGVISLFWAQQRSFRQQSDLARNQAQVRSALHVVARDIRMAAYSGIPLGFDRVPNLTGQPGVYPIRPWPMESSSVLDDGTPLPRDPKYGQSEAIEVWGNFLRETTTVSGNYANGSSSININNPALLKNNHIKRILIGNENAVSYHEITSLTEGATVATIGISPPLPAAVFDGDVVSPIMRRIFFVRQETRTTGGLRERVGVLVRRTYMVDPTQDPPNYSATCFLDEALADQIDYLNVKYNLVELDPSNEPTENIDTSPDVPGSQTNNPSNPCRIVSVELQMVSRTWGPLTAQGERNETPLVLDYVQKIQPRNIGLSNYVCTTTPALSTWNESPCPTSGTVIGL